MDCYLPEAAILAIICFSIARSEEHCLRDVFSSWSSVPPPLTFTEISDENLNIWRSFIKLIVLIGETYVVFQVLLSMAFPMSQTPLLLQVNIVGPLVCSIAVRLTSGKVRKLSSKEIEWMAMIFNAAAIMARMDLPKQLLPGNFLMRTFIGTWSNCPRCLVMMNLLCEPLAFSIEWKRDIMKLDGKGSDLAHAIANEFFCMLFMNVIILHLAAVFQKQEVATQKLKEEITAKERIVNETESLLVAARRLLSVTCDCLLQLSDDWKLKQPDSSVKDMLRLGSCDPVADLQFAQFVSPEDHERFYTFIRTSRDSTSPSSLHLKMQDMKGSPFHAQLFHVEMVKLTDFTKEHLLGLIRQELKEPWEDEALAAPSCCPIPETRPLTCTQPSSSNSSRTAGQKAHSGRRRQGPVPSEAKPQELWSNLDSLKLTIDLNTTQHGYAIRAMSMNLRENCPDLSLLKFVKRKCRPEVEDWIQEHMNRWMMQSFCDESCSCYLQLDGCDILVRDMKVLSIEQLPARVDSDPLGYTLLMTMELTNFLNTTVL